MRGGFTIQEAISIIALAIDEEKTLVGVRAFVAERVPAIDEVCVTVADNKIRVSVGSVAVEAPWWHGE